MSALRIWLVAFMVAAPSMAVSTLTLEPMEEPVPEVDFRLEERIGESGERLATLDRALAGARVEVRSASEDFPLASIGQRLRSLQRLQARLDSWHRASLQGLEIRSEAQQLGLLLQLESAQRSLTRELATPLGVAAATGGRFGLALRNGGTGTFSGTITEEGTGVPLAGVEIHVFDDSGSYLAWATTNGAGAFTTPSLDAGTYYAYTVDPGGHVNELYDDIFCTWICSVTDGAPIAVADGGDTPGIDFVLAPGGRISGTIRDDDTDALLEGVIVDLFDAEGSWVSNPVTDAAGVFLSPGFPAGTYYATTYNELQYLDERWADHACPFGCDPTEGWPIEVAIGATTDGVDFDLTRGGWISGTVTEQIGGSPIVGAWVRIHDSSGQWVTDDDTDGSGDYLSRRGLPAGAYYARSDNDLGYLDELFSQRSCAGSCDVTAGDAIAVSLGAATIDVDFTLATGGSIAGSVIEEGTGVPIAGVYVDVFDSLGDFLTSGFTDGSGAYEVETGLLPGTYYARTVSPAPWVDELYDGELCPTWCTVTEGEPIVVVSTDTTSGIDFVLGRGGQIAGTVSEQGGGPLEGVWVDVFDPEGGHVANGPSDATGVWRTGSALPAGSYYVRTWNDLGYVDELFEELTCPGSACDVTVGRDVDVFSTATTVGVDFELSLGEVLTGTVRERGTGAPIDGAAVEIWNALGSWTGFGMTDAAGVYRLPAMPAGRYYLKTWNELGYVDQLHEEIPCLGCVARGGEPVTVPGAGAVDFDLDRGGRITGVVTEEVGGTPVADAHVELWSATGRLLWWTATAGSGEYALERLPAGSYFLKTSNDQGWVDEVWNDRQCAACDATEGTPVAVVVGETTADVDFALVSGGSISGTVTIDEQAIVDRIRVRVFDAQGWLAGVVLVNSDGSYVVSQLPAGSYRVRTANGAGYVDEVWDNVSCVGDCDLGSGTPVLVTSGVVASGVDFELELGARIAGTVTEAQTGLPIDDAQVGIYDSSGNRLLTSRVGSDGHFRSWGAVPAGTYHAATENFAGLYDEVYEDVACVGGGDVCDVTAGTPIVVDAGSVVEGIDFTLASGGGWIEGSVFDALWAHPLPDADVEIYDAGGDLVSRVVWEAPSDGTGRFKSSGLQPGTYFVRTDTTALRVPYLDEVWDDVACSGGCDPTTGTPIVVSGGIATAGVDLRLGPQDATIFVDGFESGTTGVWSASVGEVP